jgi:hypothetical protein
LFYFVQSISTVDGKCLPYGGMSNMKMCGQPVITG